MGNEVKEIKEGRSVGRSYKGGEVGGEENLGADKGAKKSLGKGKGCVFGSSPKWLKHLHPKLLH
jgi:hypothetical protein